MKRFYFLILFFNQLGATVSAQDEIMDAQSALKITRKVADWQLESWSKKGMKWPLWDWTNGACYTGFMALNQISNDQKYINAMTDIGNRIEWNTGPNRTMADDYCVGQLFSQLYKIFKKKEMIEHFKSLADSIVLFPHKESLEWINNIQSRELAWCDALFMSPPALAYLFKATGEIKYLNTADKLWWKTTDFLYDSLEHLFTRDSRYFNKREANGEKVFWSRGNGWVMGGIVRMLENMPADFPGRLKYIRLFKEMADKIAQLQHNDGTWHTALLDPSSYPAKETSGTGFYCYALAYGINKGILDYNKFYPVVNKAWRSLVLSVHNDGMLGYVQEINEKPGVVDSNSSASYGVGAFLLAGSQMIDLSLYKFSKKYIHLFNRTDRMLASETLSIPVWKFNKLETPFSKSNIKLINVVNGEAIPFKLVASNNKFIKIILELNLIPGAEVYIQCLRSK